jgi:TRAP-type C4-dicarboxylate transport system substrate-binding protein
MPRTLIVKLIRLAIAPLVIAALLPADAAATQLKVATIAPEGSFWMQEARKGAAEIAERTSGRVELRFYPGGTMGDEQAVLRKMRIGQLHGGVILSGSLAASAPDLEIYNLPLLFRSYAEVDHIREEFDPILLEQVEQAGYVSFGLIEGGFAYLMSTFPATSLDDLKGRKAWLPEGDVIAQAILEESGLAAVPLPLSDVLTGLQTGLIDTIAGPPVGAVALQWFTKAQYLAEIPVMYTYGTIVLSQRAMSRLSDADAAVVREVMAKVTRALDRRTRTDNREALEALEAQGVRITAVSERMQVEWEDVAERSRSKLVDRMDIDAKLLDAIERELSTLRSATDG